MFTTNDNPKKHGGDNFAVSSSTPLTTFTQLDCSGIYLFVVTGTRAKPEVEKFDVSRERALGVQNALVQGYESAACRR